MKKALVYKPENSVGKFKKKMVANGGTNPFFSNAGDFTISLQFSCLVHFKLQQGV